MTCRHAPDDRSCTTQYPHYDPPPKTPDKKKFSFDACFWKEIDPHFAIEGTKRTKQQAPAPIARFPPSNSGWADAITYAKSKT